MEQIHPVATMGSINEAAARASEPQDRPAPKPIADQATAAQPFGQPLTKDDKAVETLFQDFLNVLAEAEQDSSFCGFRTLVTRNADGAVLSFKVVFMDNLGGIVAPREA
jgi:hypothetical protein